MSWLSRFVNVLRRGRLDRDLDEEIQFHIEARAEEFAREGMSAEAARNRARLQFGNTLLLRESSRDIKLLPLLESIRRDVEYGFRVCRRSKVVTATILVSLSLAIGVSRTGPGSARDTNRSNDRLAQRIRSRQPLTARLAISEASRSS